MVWGKAKSWLFGLGCLGAVAASSSYADVSPFQSGWSLELEYSSLSFTSVAQGETRETSVFQDFSGEIDEAGNASIRIALDSVMTRNDLRDVRLRFVLFETFNLPEATINMTIPEALIADMTAGQSKTIELPFELNFVGLTREMTAQMLVDLSDHNVVAISSVEPIDFSVDLFDLQASLAKLEETSGVAIEPDVSVSFDLTFARNEPIGGLDVARVETTQTEAPGAPAKLTLAECSNRFKGLSESNSIVFEPAGLRITRGSVRFLRILANVMEDCPEINLLVAGHTDATGSEELNLTLSEQRAETVRSVLVKLGAAPERLSARGFGETVPIAENDTPQGRARNRRIEFEIQSGS